MNELVITQQNRLAISVKTKELIKVGVSGNTLQVYRRGLLELHKWLDAAVKRHATNLNRPRWTAQSRNGRWRGFGDD